jgi:hypothetical protein
MVAFCSNAVGLRRCPGSNRDQDESVPWDCIDWILEAKHPANAIIDKASINLIQRNPILLEIPDNPSPSAVCFPALVNRYPAPD